MTQISVIIVNYNVRYFVEQAILSVKNASKNLNVEIIVIDNDSSDHSVEMIEQKFPDVTLIASKENLGFGRANNLGIETAKGQYILLLNPDTVIQEDTLEKCFKFIENNKDCGALGVKMIDGKGNFLPESKRALPFPKVAFYKMSGLSSLFPKSKTFGKYHLGFLDENKNHEVEVLSGAFMFFKADLLKKIGGFDKDYFMYGEDIDLSYQVLKQGYKNYYLADTSIIHYKGESTKKGSLNYVKVFYEAMLIFANKHFNPKQAKIYSIAIYFAIFIKGSSTILSNFFKHTTLPLLDICLSYLSVYLVATFWALEVKAELSYYPSKFYLFILPAYVLVWFFCNLFYGSYEKPYKINKIWKATFFGTLIIAAIYGFLPEDLRFSRAIILLGSVLTIASFMFTRLIFHSLKHKKISFELNDTPPVLIVGNKEEANRALNLLQESVKYKNFIGFVSFGYDENHANYLGEFKNLKDIVNVNEIEEIIYCNKDVPSQNIIASMTELGNKFNFKILPEESASIIGSNSKNSAGDLYAIDFNLKIATQRSQILKRVLDIFVSLFFILIFPILILIVNNKANLFNNLIQVLIGKKTWVSYSKDNEDIYKLPKLKSGILNPSTNKITLKNSRINLLYAKNYSIENDLKIILKSIKAIGN